MSGKKIIFIASLAAIVIIIGVLVYIGRDKIDNNNQAQTPGITLGSASAPVTIEEYTNFLCSHCADFARDTLPQIMATYVNTGKARMIFYISEPVELQKAAFCADKAGKFIDFHDYAFAHQSEITSADAVLQIAKNAGLDSAEFTQCYNSSEAGKAVSDWSSKLVKETISGTPTFFINGQKIEGAFPYSEYEKVIESKLK
ncbi:MAG: thioredoxin domain-containing protein [bacterium]